MDKNYCFEKETGVVRITDPDTGKLWYNQLWNEDGYLASVSHVGNGSSRHISCQSGMQVLLNSDEERYLYIRDEKDKSFWNIGVSPSMIPVENYCCEHGQDYTRISSEHSGLKSSLLFTVPEKGSYEIWQLTLENKDSQPKTLSIFPYIGFDLGGYPQPAYYNPPTTSETVYVEEMNGILCWSKNPHQPHERCSGFLASSEKAAYYDGWLERFNGAIGNYARPEVLTKGLNCTNSLTTVRARGAVLQNVIRIDPGAVKIIYYFAGFSTDPGTAVKEYKEALKEAERTCLSAAARGIERFGTLRVDTPDDFINNIMNFWTQKQVEFCGIGKKAVRDNAQIAMGILNFDAELAEQSIAECLSHQFQDGHAVLTWSPSLDPKLYSDPPMWLVLAVCETIKETGSIKFLDTVLPFLDSGSASVYEHLKKAMDWLLENLGPNGLPLIHYADWNDALNIPDENAESIFMAMSTAWAMKELLELAKYIGDFEYSRELSERRARLVSTINSVAWNGDYYIRALSRAGNVGDKSSPVGGNIYINPQTWSILGDVVPPEYLEKLCRSIDGMDTELGIPLCKPPYYEYYHPVGRMSGMLPGVYENGGIYNHACGFKIMADCKIGRCDEALQSLVKMIPDGKNNPSRITTTEPYVFTNCYLTHESAWSVVGFSWQTGASAWALRGFYEGILGLVRTYDGIRIKPALIKEWKHVTAKRVFRGTQYNITYNNHGGNTVQIYVDGNRTDTDILPLFSDKGIHNVTVDIL